MLRLTYQLAALSVMARARSKRFILDLFNTLPPRRSYKKCRIRVDTAEHEPQILFYFPALILNAHTQ